MVYFESSIAYIIGGVIVIIIKLGLIAWYCFVAKRKKRLRDERARAALQAHLQGNDGLQQPSFVISSAGTTPQQGVPGGFNASNYWNLGNDETQPGSGFAPPPSYSSTGPSPYPVQKY